MMSVNRSIFARVEAFIIYNNLILFNYYSEWELENNLLLNTYRYSSVSYCCNPSFGSFPNLPTTSSIKSHHVRRGGGRGYYFSHSRVMGKEIVCLVSEGNQLFSIIRF
ncbi:hypothetical protein XENE109146_12825 [Xenorhabdus nematophila]